LSALYSFALQKSHERLHIDHFFDACKAKSFHNKWMSAQTWADIIIHNFSIQPELQFNGASLGKALGKSHLSVSMDIPWTQIPPDHCGIFCQMLQPKGKSKTYYFYATTSGNGSSLEKAWTEDISLGNEFTTTKNSRSNVLNSSIEQEVQHKPSTTKKRKRNHTAISIENPHAGRLFGGSLAAPEEPSAASSLGVVVCEPSQSYWASTEAKKLFKPLDDEQDALEAIMNQMELSSDVLSDAKGYWSVMVGLERDDDLTAYQKLTIQIRCQYLYCSLYYAKEMIPISRNWDRCCQEAVKHLLLCGIKAGCSRSVRNWHLEFTRKNRKFEMRVPEKHKLPMFLDLNRYEKEKLQQYTKEHLHELSIERMSEYIHETVIPIMVQERFAVKPEDE
jgi:hypothetical protein